MKEHRDQRERRHLHSSEESARTRVLLSESFTELLSRTVNQKNTTTLDGRNRFHTRGRENEDEEERHQQQSEKKNGKSNLHSVADCLLSVMHSLRERPLFSSAPLCATTFIPLCANIRLRSFARMPPHIIIIHHTASLCRASAMSSSS